MVRSLSVQGCPSLIPRKQWQAERWDMRVYDIVVVAETNAVRGKWCLGRVTEVYPGLDGGVRLRHRQENIVDQLRN